MATILDLALPDGSNLLADLSHTPAKAETSKGDQGKDKHDAEAKNELIFKLVKKDGGFAIPIGTAQAQVLLAMLAAGAKAS